MVLTWFAKPIPKPSNNLPTINIQTALAKPLIRAPAKKSKPPKSMDNLLPSLRVTVEATSDAKRAAKYSDEVNIVSVWLSYWQYWFVDLLASFFSQTSRKNFWRKGVMVVTPPIKKYHWFLRKTNKNVWVNCVCVFLNVTWNPNIVAENQTTHGGDNTCYSDERSEVSRVFLAVSWPNSSCRRHVLSVLSSMETRKGRTNT